MSKFQFKGKRKVKNSAILHLDLEKIIPLMFIVKEVIIIRKRIKEGTYGTKSSVPTRTKSTQ
jgi:hypothetical protein